MKKRLICIVLSIISLVCLNSCEGDNGNKTLNETLFVAVITDSDETVVAKSYCSTVGAELIEYKTSSDVVVALQNGKADYAVLNEYDAQEFLDAGSEISFLEKCEDKMEYRAIFNIDDTELCKQFNDAILALKQNGTLEKIKESNRKGESYKIPQSTGEKGELVMLCDPIFENTIFYDDSGELKGTDIDIAKTICAYLGYTLVVKVTDFDEMFINLDKGNGDFIMSAAEYTDERAADFCISDVYATLEYHIYVRQK